MKSLNSFILFHFFSFPNQENFLQGAGYLPDTNLQMYVENRVSKYSSAALPRSVCFDVYFDCLLTAIPEHLDNTDRIFLDALLS